MQVTNTTDKIELVLGSNVTTNQLHINASYNIISSTGITPAKTSITSSNTTAVDIVPAPSSGNQHQLRYCNIFNSDSNSETVIVRTNYNGTTRSVVSTVLQVNEYIQYTYKTGWKVFDANGSLKITDSFNTITEYKFNKFFLATTTGGVITPTNLTPIATYLGKATGNYKTIHIQNFVNTAFTGSGATFFTELAIYKGTPTLGSTNTTLTRVGFIDASISWLAASLKFSSINVEGNVTAGDDLWAVVAYSGSSGALRGSAIPDDVGAGFIQTCGSARPSTSTTLIGTGSVTQTQPWIAWSGV